MIRKLLVAASALAAVGCAHNPQSLYGKAAPMQCYAESGYVDSTNGCSERAGYPDCYLVCPDQHIRKKL